jgi:cobalt transporter subunit CbtB
MRAFISSLPLGAVDRDSLRYGIAAILLGFVFIGVTGFAHPEAIHDAAHNTRHAISFPCH